jgi:preprotein translocase subunit YajC
MDPLLLPLLFIAVLALPLILGSRRQKKAMAEAQRLQNSLTVGDRVLTASGLRATVVDTSDEDTVDLEIAPGVRTTWLRAAIREKITPDDAAEDSAVDYEDSEETDAVAAAPVDAPARSDKP